MISNVSLDELSNSNMSLSWVENLQIAILFGLKNVFKKRNTNIFLQNGEMIRKLEREQTAGSTRDRMVWDRREKIFHLSAKHIPNLSRLVQRLISSPSMLTNVKQRRRFLTKKRVEIEYNESELRVSRRNYLECTGESSTVTLIVPTLPSISRWYEVR